MDNMILRLLLSKRQPSEHDSSSQIMMDAAGSLLNNYVYLIYHPGIISSLFCFHFKAAFPQDKQCMGGFQEMCALFSKPSIAVQRPH